MPSPLQGRSLTPCLPGIHGLLGPDWTLQDSLALGSLHGDVTQGFLDPGHPEGLMLQQQHQQQQVARWSEPHQDPPAEQMQKHKTPQYVQAFLEETKHSVGARFGQSTRHNGGVQMGIPCCKNTADVC